MDEVYMSVDAAKRVGVEDGDIVFHGMLQFIVKIDPKLKNNIWFKSRPQVVCPIIFEEDV